VLSVSGALPGETVPAAGTPTGSGAVRTAPPSARRRTAARPRAASRRPADTRLAAGTTPKAPAPTRCRHGFRHPLSGHDSGFPGCFRPPPPPFPHGCSPLEPALFLRMFFLCLALLRFPFSFQEEQYGGLECAARPCLGAGVCGALRTG